MFERETKKAERRRKRMMMATMARLWLGFVSHSIAVPDAVFQLAAVAVRLYTLPLTS